MYLTKVGICYLKCVYRVRGISGSQPCYPASDPACCLSEWQVRCILIDYVLNTCICAQTEPRKGRSSKPKLCAEQKCAAMPNMEGRLMGSAPVMRLILRGKRDARSATKAIPPPAARRAIHPPCDQFPTIIGGILSHVLSHQVGVVRFEPKHTISTNV